MHAVYYSDEPATPTDRMGSIRMEITGPEREAAGGGRIAELRLVVEVRTSRGAVEGDLNQTKLNSLCEKVRTRLHNWAPGTSGTVTFTSVTFIEPLRGKRDVGKDVVSNIMVFGCVAAIGLSQGISTGQTLAVSGTLASGSGGVNTSIPFQMQFQPFVRLVDVSRRTEDVDRFTQTSRGGTATLRFMGGTTASPKIPLGKYSTLTITLLSGQAYSGEAWISRMDLGSARGPDPVAGNYSVVFSGDITGAFGS